MSKQVSYNNTVYNSHQLNERKELKEINNKLTSYFNSVRLFFINFKKFLKQIFFYSTFIKDKR